MIPYQKQMRATALFVFVSVILAISIVILKLLNKASKPQKYLHYIHLISIHLYLIVFTMQRTLKFISHLSYCCNTCQILRYAFKKICIIHAIRENESRGILKFFSNSDAAKRTSAYLSHSKSTISSTSANRRKQENK